jgi:Exostosin family
VRVFLTTSDHPAMADRITEMAAALTRLAPAFEPADGPEGADIILLVEPFYNKFRSHIGVLRQLDVLRRFPNRCFVYEACARPVTFLPGLYVSLPRRRHDGRRTRSAVPWTVLDPRVRENVIAATRDEPELLFSFRGFRSAGVRTAIFESWRSSNDVRVSETTRWWNYSTGERDQVDYLTEIRISKFVLCPRGLGTSSNRLYEVMQLGRVPVILADDWDEPGGIPWGSFSIRVSESRVAELRAILERHAPVAAEMGAQALAAWREFCEPGPVLLGNLLASIDDIGRVRPGDWDEALVHTGWTSTRFLWANGIHPAQGAYAAYRSGQLIPRLRARFQRGSRAEDTRRHTKAE